jgi:hypothetical protein
MDLHHGQGKIVRMIDYVNISVMDQEDSMATIRSGLESIIVHKLGKIYLILAMCESCVALHNL